MSARATVLRRMLAQLVCAVTFVMPVAVWCMSTSDVLDYFVRAVPPGQTLFVFSKLFALLALTMLWFQGMSALAKDTPGLDGFPRLSRRGHFWFGSAAYAAVWTHLALFIGAATIRTGQVALDLLWPTFSAGFYRAMLSLGTIAFWLLLVALIGGVRRMYGSRRSRWVHRAVFIAFAAAFVHGVTIGSETRFGLMAYVYAFVGLSLATAVVSRCWIAMRRRQRQSSIELGSAVVAAVSKGDGRVD